MRILHAKLLIKHSGGIDEDFYFIPNLIEIIIDIVMLVYEPNIHMELQYTFLQDFL